LGGWRTGRCDNKTADVAEGEYSNKWLHVSKIQQVDSPVTAVRYHMFECLLTLIECVHALNIPIRSNSNCFPKHAVGRCKNGDEVLYEVRIQY
jgi:hypothetical protein